MVEALEVAEPWGVEWATWPRDGDGDGDGAGGRLTGHRDTIASVATALVGGRAVALTGGRDAVARLWQVDHGRLLAELPVDRWADVTLGTLDGRPVVLGVDGRAPEFTWDPATGRCLRTLPVDDALSVATTRLDGRPVAVTGHQDTTVRFWDVTDGRELGRPLHGHTHPVHVAAVAVIGDRPVAATSSGMNADQSFDPDVRLWDLTTGTPIAAFRAATTSAVDAVALADLAGRPVVATGDWRGRVRLWDPSSGRPEGVAMPDGPTDGVWALAATALGGRPVLAAGSDDGTLRLWDVATHERIGPVLRFPHPVRGVAAAPGDRLVVCFGPHVAVLAHRG
ncbi:WD40 repeat domain-containing protein [Kitasatospora sp. NPDC127111]|uniref:WD40 repeat domain-containing protein n=1 Tax=Kitasatospora sp. NPDC127111 TaxID=3345363 RepID=UPI003628C1D9